MGGGGGGVVGGQSPTYILNLRVLVQVQYIFSYPNLDYPNPPLAKPK